MKIRLMVLLFSVLSSTMLYADTVAYYNFEEGSNGLGATGTAPSTSGWVLDSAGTNNSTAYIQGGYPQYISDAAFRSMGDLAMKFGYKKNSLTIPNSSAVQWSEDASKTLEFFIRRDGNGPDGSSAEFIMSKNYTSSGGWQMYFNRTNKTIKFQVQTAVVESTAVFEDGVWHHVAITHAANSGKYEIYVDYVKDCEITGFTSGSVTTPTLLIGKGYGWMDQRVFNGAIDDFRVSNVVLSTDEFIYRDVLEAYQPTPVDGALNIASTTTLSWVAGDFAQTHKLYIGQDYEAVLAATEVSPEYMGEVALNEYSALLELNKTYYWRVDEIDDTNSESPWKSDVWRFATRDYMVVDDFESYNDEAGLEATWAFTQADPNNLQSSDSTVGATERFAGDKGMQIAYNLSDTSSLSSATCVPSITDWTVDEITAISFYAKFEADSVDADIQVQLSDSTQSQVSIYITEELLNDGAWHLVALSLNDFEAIDLTDIQGLSIQVSNGVGEGYLYIDSITILQGICGEALSADINGDCRVDIEDLMEVAGNWAQTTLWPL